MSLEQQPAPDDLDRRVRAHAALADPVRLGIVDVLSLGDASSSELGLRLGVPSNLLAHHVNVLERAGLISRRRSEADRRRSYLRLVPGALAGPAAVPATRVHRVVFVCTANTARSRLAVAIWRRSSKVPATSAGTHPADRVDPGAVSAAHRHGLRLGRTRPRSLGEILDRDDFVVTVCDSAHEELARDASRPSSLHWSVPDPVPAGTADAFDRAFDDISYRVPALTQRVIAA